ncbi:hypothetical protein [Aurantibacter sp.]|uniref:hypothetical protein n=1 Tax=Aurantibacter sp. TaxID=2807103 RepID=UPI003264C136
MIKIQFMEPHTRPCLCCGNTTFILTRFVDSNKSARAVYYAKYTMGHTDKIVNLIIGLGDWGENTIHKNRTAFPLQIWKKNGEYIIDLIDKSETPWFRVDYLGRILDRQESQEHKLLREAMDITSQILLKDKNIIDYLN